NNHQAYKSLNRCLNDSKYYLTKTTIPSDDFIVHDNSPNYG
ncbi:unnamed protein product, partial [Rotaria sp. Silwood1]